MAAVTGHLEQSPEEIEDQILEAKRAGIDRKTALASFGAGELTEGDDPGIPHGHLTGMVWNRRLLEEQLAKSEIRVEWKAGYQFVLDPPLPENAIPWNPGSGPIGRLKLMGSMDGNSKMRCPTFDLPAGAGPVGGSCPGAISAQTTVPKSQREAALERGYLAASPPGVDRAIKVDTQKTICSRCYAGTGFSQYAMTSPQAGEIVRFWWTKGAVQSGEFEKVMVRELLAQPYPVNPHAFNGGMLKPVRVHSSGDFYSIDYAKAWIRVANELWGIDRSICLWAPTRTWVHAKWQRAWLSLLDELHGNNLVVRASAYHFDDEAPWRLHPKNAAGTCSIYKASDESTKDSTDPRYDFMCPIYDEDAPGDANTCQTALNPDTTSGSPRGCRICWTHPERRVNYQAHF